MEQAREVIPSSAGHQSSREWAKLICKLRWIGMDDEAHRLQKVVSTLPSDERVGVVADPFGTD